MDTAGLTPKEIQTKIESKKKKIYKLNQEIKDIQELCQHDWNIIKNWNDHDGWSIVEITWYQNRKCKICEKYETIKTGTSRY